MNFNTVSSMPPLVPESAHGTSSLTKGDIFAIQYSSTEWEVKVGPLSMMTKGSTEPLTV